ncbi:uncharacterized protein UV8b_01930 [Ustilaginoidea virens]|uniref:Uncharacterized protein n=1 Tax=Ustilaginoidea virens TaxID=1159556 RepID=A0A8E5HLI5_USTVR|nr:uncharacterized protein UV8b_01930 [Ustilaginoidea virens]QUC17689.1 hypothetical protein UV8b_01930 [Ustilaginoidea virens]
MRFSVALVSGLAAVVSAQSSTSSADPAIASAAACLEKCARGDVNCQSHCITVPSPNEEQVIETTKCVAACPQGNGSPADTQKYADCSNACIKKHFYVSSEGTPEATGGSNNNGGSGAASSSAASAAASASASASAAASSAAATGASPSNSGSGSGSDSSSPTAASKTSGSGTGTATGTAAAATTTNAAPGLTFGSSGAFVGAVVALLAL